MKLIGLIGGMSWESTVTYYQHLNRMARERLGELHSAKILLWSFDFAEIEALQAQGDWEAATGRMVEAARRLEAGGAQCLGICTNTMHRMAADIEAAVPVPLVHIADATASAIDAAGSRRPLLLATRYTMEQDFYRGRLRDRHGIEAVVPDEGDRTTVHDIIYQELCQGVIRENSRERYLEIAEKYFDDGADGIIFGCTEIGLLVKPSDFRVPAFDTTELHARALLEAALP